MGDQGIPHPHESRFPTVEELSSSGGSQWSFTSASTSGCSRASSACVLFIPARGEFSRCFGGLQHPYSSSPSLPWRFSSIVSLIRWQRGFSPVGGLSLAYRNGHLFVHSLANLVGQAIASLSCGGCCDELSGPSLIAFPSLSVYFCYSHLIPIVVRRDCFECECSGPIGQGRDHFYSLLFRFLLTTVPRVATFDLVEFCAWPVSMGWVFPPFFSLW